MPRIDAAKLSTRLAKLRNERPTKGNPEPASVLLLRNNLNDSVDPGDRYMIYQLLLSELYIHFNFVAGLQCAEARLSEFGDIVSYISVARARLDLGQGSDAIEEYKTAFRRAIERDELVNYSFGELMRGAVKIADCKTIDVVSEEYLKLNARKWKNDCILETDWMESAIRLGANPRLIEALRERASR